MDDLFSALADLPKKGTRSALCTVIKTRGSTPRKTGSKMLVYEDGSIVGSVGGGEVESRVITEARQAIASGEAAIVSYDLLDPEQGDPGVCGGSLEIFIDPLGIPDEIVVVGGGHVGKAVVYLAKWLGYRVVLTDDREEFCQPDRVPGADEYICCSLADLVNRYPIAPRTAVVLATRNQDLDLAGLPGLLAIPTAYIGVISSSRRWKTTVEKLIAAGVDRSSLERVQAPIGLDLGAETPNEIALSIMAQIMAVRNGRHGEFTWSRSSTAPEE